MNTRQIIVLTLNSIRSSWQINETERFLLFPGLEKGDVDYRQKGVLETGGCDGTKVLQKCKNKFTIQLHKSTCITSENLFQRNCHRAQRHISFQQVTKDVESQDQSQNHVESSYHSFSRRRTSCLIWQIFSVCLMSLSSCCWSSLHYITTTTNRKIL